ncbi:DNA-directed RNA polymerase I subunit A2 [Phakopsora pachyrhizi]|nr:DNA-directed RNA polymerase I subunit A2 [Phakopsora pachyrhizi]
MSSSQATDRNAVASSSTILEGPPPSSSSFNTLQREKTFRNPSNRHTQNPAIHELVAPHIQSFNALFGAQDGSPGLIGLAVEDLPSKVVFDSRSKAKDGTALPRNRLEFKISEVFVSNPMTFEKGDASRDRVYPYEARERLSTYAGKLSAKITWSLNHGTPQSEHRDFGLLPIMVKSEKCNIKHMPPRKLINHHEESEEMGGYFVVNGNEKLIRCLIIPRRNHVMAIVRPVFVKRGNFYTQFACQVRGVRIDQTSQTNTLHYLSNGNLTFRFSWRKSEYIIPVVLLLKALVGGSDQEIFAGLTQNKFDDTFRTDRIELLLRNFKHYNLFTSTSCREFLGQKFKVVLGCPEDWTDEKIGVYLIDRVVLVHLKDYMSKYRFLLFMIQKLYSLVAGECCADNPDSPQHQEILLPGHLLSSVLKERFEEYLIGICSQIAGDVRKGLTSVNFFDPKFITKSLQKVYSDIGRRVTFFLATGNLVSPSGLDLQQTSGFTLIAEKLNFYRYISHFRSVHRGAFFAELKTTAVRKLLPEAWGFLCPVHTPDGAPCGLLNHFAHKCKIITACSSVKNIPALLISLGMSQPFDKTVDPINYICVQLDGEIIGWATPSLCTRISTALRVWKTEGLESVPPELEIGLVPQSKGGQFPGLFLFSTPARMMRPVTLLLNGRIDLVGSFEQVYLEIACSKEEVATGISSHLEISPTHMLSLLANLTPFSDFNQSPRNMYQCQMSKQTMGTPSTVINHRTDNKLYRLQTGQTPIVRPTLHDVYNMDHFPNGTNAIVAVISYTGYDMEDAMILNKSAHERDFAYGTIYKSHIVDIHPTSAGRSSCEKHFGLGSSPVNSITADASFQKMVEKVDSDGIARIGTKLKFGDPLCAYVDRVTGRTHWEKYKGDEEAILDEVRLIGNDSASKECTKIHFKLRVPRPPVIGDKFSSRHGQKGVCSQKWPSIDMPFSESGIQPDVIINPHAFPSRMTIGMFVESLAGKAGAMHGIAQDATPFRFSEQDTPSSYFGEQLLAAGYNYHGNEPMYSGITGEEFAADIYIGVVFYQRLRHMVGDKWQVRTTGKVDQLTRQPVKGRRRGGGIRFGEMERDALLAHGTSFLLQDRLMNCSDYSTAWICKRCGLLVSLGYDLDYVGNNGLENKSWDLLESVKIRGPNGEYCRICEAEELKVGLIGRGSSLESMVGKLNSQMDVIAIPYVFRYLIAELMAMGIK